MNRWYPRSEFNSFQQYLTGLGDVTFPVEYPPVGVPDDAVPGGIDPGPPRQIQRSGVLTLI